MQKLLATLLLTTSLYAGAAQLDNSSFTIQSIDIEGLQRISLGTVYSYLPIKVGDQMSSAESTQVIKDLYDTSFFSNISLSRRGNTLVINLQELPVISAIHLSGNKDIPTDKLMKVLSQNGFVEGHVYNHVFIKEMRESLQDQYYAQGKYNARVDLVVKDEPRNRVSIDIKISEGVVAKIYSINVVGNHVFSQDTLLDQLTISTPGWFTWFTSTDEYTSDKLSASLSALSDYYMDRGYIKFHVDSAQVALTPDRKSVYVTINVTEGDKYTFKGHSLAGHFILPKDQIEKLVTIKAGDVFSRQTVLDTDKAISRALGNMGYAFAKVEAIPTIDEKNKSVFMALTVEPGVKTYVNEIHFHGNSNIDDEVLRNNMRQMEGAVWDTDNVEQSKWRLQQLPYISDIQMTPTPVPGTKDKVDVDYKITEKNSANFTASIGYSQLDGIILSAGVTEHDFLGTGKTVGFNFQKSRGYQSYAINYTNPYYTQDGVSRSISAYLTKVNPGKLNLTNSYSLSQSGLAVSYDIPISESLGEQQDFNIGYGLEHTALDIGAAPPTQVTSFMREHGSSFTAVNLTSGWSLNGFDRVVFPTKGFTESINTKVAVPATNKSIGYYTAAYQAEWYKPIFNNSDRYLFQLKGSTNYGGAYWRSGQLPFYENFYAGGIGSVRGYEGNTLGPLDSDGNPFGGNFSVYGTAGLVVPSLIAPNSLRTTLFLDGGNVFSTYSHSGYRPKISSLRYSAGIEFDWLTPLGAINISLAKPLNAKPTDQTQFFQFSIGQTF